MGKETNSNLVMNKGKATKLRNFLLSIPAGILVGNPIGLLVAATIFLGLELVLPRVITAQIEQEQKISQEEVFEFIEVVALGASAGLTTLECLKMSSDFVSEKLSKIVTSVIARCQLGLTFSQSISIAAIEHPALETVVRTLIQADSTGGSIHESLRVDLQILRIKNASRKLKRVKSAPIKCVFPLGLCFLPAFFLLTIVPIIATLLPKLLPAV